MRVAELMELVEFRSLERKSSSEMTGVAIMETLRDFFGNDFSEVYDNFEDMVSAFNSAVYFSSISGVSDLFFED